MISLEASMKADADMSKISIYSSKQDKGLSSIEKLGARMKKKTTIEENMIYGVEEPEKDDF